jgi:hypothetical protein
MRTERPRCLRINQNLKMLTSPEQVLAQLDLLGLYTKAVKKGKFV